MAIAYLDSAITPDRALSPNRCGATAVGLGGIRSDDGVPRRQVDLLAIARGFAVSAGDITELHDLSERSWVLLAVTDLFEAWAIGWPPGGLIELHDHGQSHGAVTVARGSLTETTVRATDHGIALIGTHHLNTGEHRTFGPNYVHDLINEGDEDAISVHVYGPKLTTMTYFELGSSGRLGAVRVEETTPIGPFDTTSVHDPS